MNMSIVVNISTIILIKLNMIIIISIICELLSSNMVFELSVFGIEQTHNIYTLFHRNDI